MTTNSEIINAVPLNPPLVVSGDLDDELDEGRNYDYTDGLAVAFVPDRYNDDDPSFVCDYLVVVGDGRMHRVPSGSVTTFKPWTPAVELSPTLTRSVKSIVLDLMFRVDDGGATKKELADCLAPIDRQYMDAAVDVGVASGLFVLDDDTVYPASRKN